MKKLSARIVFHKLHLWLGLVSGIVIFIVAITGAIYAFHEEIDGLFRPSLAVEATGKPFLSPDDLKQKVSQYIFKTPADSNNIIQGVTYGTYEQAAEVACSLGKKRCTLYVNPYSGAVIHKEGFRDGFFHTVLAGHRSLWLPRPIGKAIVGWSIVIFVLITLSGIVIWFPVKQTKRAFKNGLKIKWNAPFSRVNYDLHKVLGFYTAIFALIIALTGLTWSFSWFAEGYYGLITGGKEFKKWELAQSDSTQTTRLNDPSDLLWEQMNKEYPIGQKGTFRFDYPEEPTDAYTVCYNPSSSTYYQREFRFFDRNTLQEVKGGGTYGIKQSEASWGDKLYRMTYDIHVGAILGLPGKILVFLVSLVIASLPITGYIIWWRKRRKKH
nr:PepSY-associated TM helix domain-containing protein [uncultured Bacteroides sp.]